MRFWLLRSGGFFLLLAVIIYTRHYAAISTVERVSFIETQYTFALVFALLGFFLLIAATVDNLVLRLVAMALKLAWAVVFAVLLIFAATLANGSWVLAVCFAWIVWDFLFALQYWAMTETQERELQAMWRQLRTKRREAERELGRADSGDGA